MNTDGDIGSAACRVLFLDIDGVLNRCGMSPKGQGLESDKVTLLEWILRRSGCSVVLSSTWRKYDHTKARVERMFDDLGMTDRLIGSTPVLESEQNGLWRTEPRGHEIKAWLDEHPEAGALVILDDDGDMRTLKPFLVQTESFTGLTPEIATEVVRRLNAK